MDRFETGRYRRSQVRRKPAWLRRLALSTLVLALTATLSAAMFRTGPLAEESGRAFQSADSWRSDNSNDVARGSGRLSDGEAGEPAVEPTVAATILGPMINGRRQPAPIDPPQSGEGKYEVVAGGNAAPKRKTDEVLRYIVEVERGLPFDPDKFADDVHTILNDKRGWGYDGSVRFRRVDEGPVAFRVSLSSANQTDDQCAPLQTLGKVSCWNGTRAVINAERWGKGAGPFRGDILTYREYLINHEVGHGLGHGHENCPEKGALAPVMVQQTKSLQGCQANPWPAL